MIFKSTEQPYNNVKNKNGQAQSFEPMKKGFEMLQRMGYVEGNSLGKFNNGPLEPLFIEPRPQRLGLGMLITTKKQRQKQNRAARKAEEASRKAEERRKTEEEANKVMRNVRQEATKKMKDLLATKAKEKAIKKAKEEAAKKAKEEIAKKAKEEAARKAKEETIRKGNSENKAKEEAARKAKEVLARKAKEETIRKGNSENKAKEEAARKAKEVLARKAKEETIIRKGNSENKAKEEAAKNSKAQSAVKMPSSCKTQQKFSLNDSNLSVQLPAIALQFRNEIQVFQQYLLKLHSSVDTESGIFLAKIQKLNNKLISAELFNMIRNEIIGYIGKYQFEGEDTPIFHNMKNNGSNITIVCENLYAYECLHKAVVEIVRLKMLLQTITIIKVPPVTNLLYCYGAVYEGIIGDKDLFLTQIKLHKPELEANHWIVVSHEVWDEKNETHFILLLDEQSALTITYHYNNKLFICLHHVKFTKRGRVPATVLN